MRWLLEERPDIRPTHSVNEGGGERIPLTDGRQVVRLLGRREGHLPGPGRRGSARPATPRCRPSGDNAVPLLGELLARLGPGMPDPSRAPAVDGHAPALLGRDEPDLEPALAEADELHPSLGDSIRALMGSTMAPTMLWGSNKRNVMPARATSRWTAGSSPGPRRRTSRRASAVRWATTWPTSWSGPRRSSPASSSPVDGVVPAAIAAFLEAEGDPGVLLPTLCTGFTDTIFLRAAGGTHAYGFSPFAPPRRRHRGRLPQRRRAGARRRPAPVDPLPRRPRPARARVSPARTPYPDPAQTDDLRDVLLDYLDFYRGVVAGELDGLSTERPHGIGGAVGVDAVGAGPPPGERRASLAGVGLPRPAGRGAVARRGRGRRVDHPRPARRRAPRRCSTTPPHARARSWNRTT